MKLLLAFSIMLSLVGSSFALAIPAYPDNIHLLCSLSGGMVSFKVTDGELIHTWYAENGKCDAPRQSPECYTRYVHRVKLSEVEIGAVRRWIIQHNLFSIPTNYLPKKEGVVSRASAYGNRIEIEIDGRKHSIAWDGDKEVPKETEETLEAATRSLQELCKKIISEHKTK